MRLNFRRSICSGGRRFSCWLVWPHVNKQPVSGHGSTGAREHGSTEYKDMTEGRHGLPLVYSCSGCSSAAQLANHVALQLDRRGVAEMSCIAGVGGDVPHLMKIARSGRSIVAL